MKVILAIDQGTTCTTTLLVDAQGKIIAQESVEFSCSYPQPSWVEFDAEKLWRVTKQAISMVLQQSEVQVVACAIANQRESVVVWERQTGNPIAPAISWQCRRTAEMCASLKASGYAEVIKNKTGLVLDAYFSATKLAWILQQKRETRQRAERGELAFGTVDSWLMWKLIGEHKTDQTNASRTMLFNINTLAWDEELLAIFAIPAAVLPEVCPSASIFGLIKDKQLRGVPVAGVAGDQQASLFGQLCFEVGMAKSTYGTGCFLMLNTGQQRIDTKTGLLATLACSLSSTPVYALEGSVFVAGSAVQWLRDNLQIINSADETAEICFSLPDSGGVQVVPAFTGLGAPYWEAEAKGAILGLTAGTTRAQIVRATLEGVALQTTAVAKAMQENSPLQTMRVDGGAAKNDFLMQFQADILGIKLERAHYTETTALGAAYLAGLQVGFWRNVAELSKKYKIERVFTPNISDYERRKKIADWEEAVSKVF